MRQIQNDKQQSILIEKAKQIFGVTESFRTAGFLLPDGELLDFGSKNGPYRIHRYDEIAQVFNKKIANPVLAFMKLGAIRITDFGFEMVIAPTFEQRIKLNQFLSAYRDLYGQVSGTVISGDGEKVCTEEYTTRIYRIEFWNGLNKVLKQRGLL